MNSHLLVHHHKAKQTEGWGDSKGVELFKDQSDKDIVENGKNQDEVEAGKVDEGVDDPTGLDVGGSLEQAASHDVCDSHGEDGQQGRGLSKRQQIICYQVRPHEVPNYYRDRF